MEQCGGAAARLTEMELKDLPIFALERSETFTDLAVPRGASFDGLHYLLWFPRTFGLIVSVFEQRFSIICPVGTVMLSAVA
jgi:hypothetical protein